MEISWMDLERWTAYSIWTCNIDCRSILHQQLSFTGVYRPKQFTHITVCNTACTLYSTINNNRSGIAPPFPHLKIWFKLVLSVGEGGALVLLRNVRPFLQVERAGGFFSRAAWFSGPWTNLILHFHLSRTLLTFKYDERRISFLYLNLISLINKYNKNGWDP